MATPLSSAPGSALPTATGLVTLPEVVTGELAGKFGKISLFD
jgi:hypothetical protein